MNTNRHELVFKDEVFQIVGCAMEVHNTLGSGFLEKIYENALAVEFKKRDIKFSQQKSISVFYKDEKVGDYIPDIIAFDTIIIDLKTIDKVSDVQRGQMLNYLKATQLRVGLIMNFKPARMEWERIVL
jgi:GxxExxY protein